MTSDVKDVIRKIRVVQSRPPTRCTLAESLRRHLRAGRLPIFIKMFAEYDGGEGVCHDVSMALIGDLVTVRKNQGWKWRPGWRKSSTGTRMAHTWVEYDGWVLDASRGECMIMRAAAFYKAACVEAMTDEDFRSEFPEFESDEP